MQELLNQDIKDCVKSIIPRQGTSKDGAPYMYLEITLINGKPLRHFLRANEDFVWENAVSMLD